MILKGLLFALAMNVVVFDDIYSGVAAKRATAVSDSATVSVRRRSLWSVFLNLFGKDHRQKSPTTEAGVTTAGMTIPDLLSSRGKSERKSSASDGTSKAEAVPSNLTTPTSTLASNASLEGFNITLAGNQLDATPTVATTGSTSTDASSTTAKKAPFDVRCFVTPTLLKFCILPEMLVSVVGGNDTILDGVIAKIFPAQVWRKLKSYCVMGSWCLAPGDPVEKSLLEGMQFPDEYCDKGLHSCLNVVASNFINCQKYKFYSIFLKSLKFLCKVRNRINGTSGCAERLFKLLHVSISDSLRKQDREPSFCQSPKAHLTTSYLCLKKECPLIINDLQSFEMWSWFIYTAAITQKKCNINLACSPNDNAVATTTRPTVKDSVILSDDTSTLHMNAIVKDPYAKTKHHYDFNNNPKVVHQSFLGEKNVKVAIGLSTATVVLAIGLTVMIGACWRKIRRSTRNKHRSSYSKLRSGEC